MNNSYLSELADDIELIPDRREVLELMVALGKELDELPAEQRVEENRVPGCVSNVHVTAGLDSEGGLTFRGSADAFIVRGYVQALFEQFNGWPPDRFVQEADLIVEDFLRRTDLAKSVVATRANSIGNILLTMKKKAVEVAEQA